MSHILEQVLTLLVIITKKDLPKLKSLIKYYRLIDENTIPIDEKTIEIVDEIRRKKLQYILGLRNLIKGIYLMKKNEKIDEFIKDGLLKKKIIVLL